MLKVEQRISSYNNEELVGMRDRVNRESEGVVVQIMGNFSSMEPESIIRLYAKMRILGSLASLVHQELERRQEQGGVI